MTRVAALSGVIAFRLAVSEVVLKEGREEVRMTVAHSNDPGDPNNSFSKFTPKADFYFTVTNPDAFGYFNPGTVYDLAAVPSDSGLTLVAQGYAPVADPPAVPVPVNAAPVADPPLETDPAPVADPPASDPPATDPPAVETSTTEEIAKA